MSMTTSFGLLQIRRANKEKPCSTYDNCVMDAPIQPREVYIALIGKGRVSHYTRTFHIPCFLEWMRFKLDSEFGQLDPKRRRRSLETRRGQVKKRIELEEVVEVKFTLMNKLSTQVTSTISISFF